MDVALQHLGEAVDGRLVERVAGRDAVPIAGEVDPLAGARRGEGEDDLLGGHHELAAGAHVRRAHAVDARARIDERALRRHEVGDRVAARGRIEDVERRGREDLTDARSGSA